MNIPEQFIRRPIATTLVMVAILVFGIVGYQALPVSDLPTIDSPTINVSCSLPGANADTIAASVALPLEEEIRHYRRPRFDELEQRPWQDLHHAAVQP